MNPYKNNNGFTMIEAIAVLMLIGIAIMIAVSSGKIDTALRGETEILQSHIAFVQSLALSNDVDTWGIRFSADSYSLLKNSVSASVSLPDEDSNFHSFTSDVSITSGVGELKFDRWGSPDPAADYLIKLNGSETITITKNTGFILHEN